MSWLHLLRKRPASGPAPTKRRALPKLETLEDRTVPSTADLTAYRPVTANFNYANYRVAEADETSHTLGAGIRYNGDDDNANGLADHADASTASAGDNDLVRVDVAVAGTNQLTYTNNLKVWTSATKAAAVASGASVSSGTVWVEYVSAAHTTSASSAVLTLNASDAAGSSSDAIVFHSFQSVVIVIGGNAQNPATQTNSVFTVAYTLYQQGYDVYTYRHDQVSSSGAGAAYNEVVSAVTNRNVDYVAVFGFSWGGGATYELAKGLSTNSSIQGQYSLKYTAYIDGITHGSISSERRLPPGTQYHDNIYQRRDWLLRGNSVTGANNLNVTNTSWGKNLVHTSIDDSTMVHSTIVSNLTSRVTR